MTDDLSSLRLRPADESDLRWLFCEAEGEMGLRSSMGPMIDKLTAGTTANRGSKPMGCTDEGGPSDHAIEVVERWRRVTARLERLPTAQRRVLAVHFGPGIPRQQAEGYPGRGSWLALELLMAERAGTGRRVVAAACVGAKGSEGGTGRVLLAGLRRAAEAALTRASRAYWEAR
jgi:hypothetical protein